MVLAAMAVVGSLVTACGGSSENTATATTSEQSSTAPAGPTLTVAPGTEITIANNDTVEHSVTSQTKGAFDVHVDGGKRKTLTAPAKPGQYQFYCVYHPSMKGTLIV